MKVKVYDNTKPNKLSYRKGLKANHAIRLENIQIMEKTFNLLKRLVMYSLS